MGRGPDLELYHPARSIAAALRKQPEGANLESGPHDISGNPRALSLNEASEEELSRSDFIDATLARRIVQARTASAGFRTWAELRDIEGLTATMVADLQRSFRLDPPAATEEEL